MSSSYDSGASNAQIPKKGVPCERCKSTKRKLKGGWPSQIVKCAKCGLVLGYTK